MLQHYTRRSSSIARLLRVFCEELTPSPNSTSYARNVSFLVASNVARWKQCIRSRKVEQQHYKHLLSIASQSSMSSCLRFTSSLDVASIDCTSAASEAAVDGIVWLLFGRGRELAYLILSRRLLASCTVPELCLLTPNCLWVVIRI